MLQKMQLPVRKWRIKRTTVRPRTISSDDRESRRSVLSDELPQPVIADANPSLTGGW